MAVLGWVAVGVGTALFLAAPILNVRANHDHRIPFNRNAPVAPPGTTLARSLGAGLLVLGAVVTAPTSGPWSLLVVLACPLLALLTLTIHNRRRATSRR